MLELGILVLGVFIGRLICGPHYRIGAYMDRWYVIPRNTWFNIYLHRINLSDDDRALHDHPWQSVSLVLWGGYFEMTPFETQWYGPGSVIYRSAEYTHRLIVEKPCWTLFVTGARERTWGFHCPSGFVDHDTFGDQGCG